MSASENQIVVYQPNETVRLDVRLENETVWLTQLKIAELFGVQKAAISKHVKNIFASGELVRDATVSKMETVQTEGGRTVVRTQEFFNLDVIIAVGYRVNSQRATQFRIWATKVLKEYLLRGYSVNARLNQLEDTMHRNLAKHDDRIATLEQKVDFFVQTKEPPLQSIFYQNKFWDAKSLLIKFIRRAKKGLIVIDAYPGVATLDMLAKRGRGVKIELVTHSNGELAESDFEAFGAQCGKFTKTICGICHDRFIIVDQKEIFWTGASLKDAGRLTFAAAKMGAEVIPGLLDSIRKATYEWREYGGKGNNSAYAKATAGRFPVSVDEKILRRKVFEMEKIKEFHLFAGIGGGIYAGRLLGHHCIGAVEILPFARKVLAQRKLDGCMDADMDIDSNTDITKMNGASIKGKFDVLCGGFPCQAFSLAAHGKNIAEKNLWEHMLRVVKESTAPIVFAENVSIVAINKAAKDLVRSGYRVKYIRLGCEELGADHRRNRFWLLAIRNDNGGTATFKRLSDQVIKLPKMKGEWWARSLASAGKEVKDKEIYRRRRLLGLGNAQSPFVAAAAFRILVNRYIKGDNISSEEVLDHELAEVYDKRKTWITKRFRETEDTTKKIVGLVHTPTTMANYCYPSMLLRHAGCRNYVKVFCATRPDTIQRPEPVEAEYLMGFPIGASSLLPLAKENFERWVNV